MAQDYPTTACRSYPLWAWPFVALWRIVTFFANAIGIMLTLLLGAVFMFIGFWLTLSVIGAVIGVPMFVIGLLLFIRGLW